MAYLIVPRRVHAFPEQQQQQPRADIMLPTLTPAAVTTHHHESLSRLLHCVLRRSDACLVHRAATLSISRVYECRQTSSSPGEFLWRASPVV